jgi:outer membrane immunogenic protein
MMKLNKLLTLSLTSIGLIITSIQVARADNTTPKSTYDWTGVYVGGFVGGASGVNGTSSTNSFVTNLGVALPQYNANSSSNYSTNSSFIGGGTVGYNWQIDKTPYLVGLEGEYGYLGMSGSSQSKSTVLDPGGVLTSTTNNKSTIGTDYGYGLIGGRLGYALNRTLLYIKSGAVFTQVKSTNSTSSSYNYMGLYDNPSASNSGETTTGYALGGGVEFAPSYFGNQNFSIKVEYLYFGIPTTIKNTSFNVDKFNTDILLKANYQNSTSGISTAKIGVNYKF